MESIQQQITTLTQKVDRIYQVIDRLDEHLDPQTMGTSERSGRATAEYPLNREDLQRLRQASTKYQASGYANLPGGTSYRQEQTEWIVTQQDVLIDSNGVEIGQHQIEVQNLSPQIQIQRLTAQLTAAYNRIAALEEQLLAKRWK